VAAPILDLLDVEWLISEAEVCTLLPCHYHIPGGTHLPCGGVTLTMWTLFWCSITKSGFRVPPGVVIDGSSFDLVFLAGYLRRQKSLIELC
jgi:hypothetical protein